MIRKLIITIKKLLTQLFICTGFCEFKMARTIMIGQHPVVIEGNETISIFFWDYCWIGQLQKTFFSFISSKTPLNITSCLRHFQQWFISLAFFFHLLNVSSIINVLPIYRKKNLIEFHTEKRKSLLCLSIFSFLVYVIDKKAKKNLLDFLAFITSTTSFKNFDKYHIILSL